MISVDEIILINEAVCQSNNEVCKIINTDNLLSAVSTQQWFDKFETQISALYRSIVLNHPFKMVINGQL